MARTQGRATTTGDNGMDRLSAFECMYLQLDRPDWPCHFGGLAIMEGATLLDGHGRLSIDGVRDRLSRRIARVPRLRQRLHRPRWFLGPPVWVDDERFSIADHVRQVTVPAPGSGADMLETATHLYAGLLDRRRPLWELWFLTGLADGRVAALFKLHHSVADGMAAVAAMGSLFDVEPLAPDPPQTAWNPRAAPTDMLLFRDNAAGLVRKAGTTASALARPSRLVRAGRTFITVVGRSLGRKGAPHTSLNGPVRAGRRVGVVRLDKRAARRVARAQNGTVNDVVLTLWTGGLRRLLESRGEAVNGLELAAGQAVSLRRKTSRGKVNNEVGTMLLPLPAWEADPIRRLSLIRDVTRTRRVRRQFPAAIAAIMAGLARTPVGTWLNHHQRAANVIVTNVPGPPAAVYLLGAPVLEILPIIQLVGNIGLTLCAFSYAGAVSLVVTADRRGFPDLDTLVLGMADEWQGLEDSVATAHRTDVIARAAASA